MSEVTTIQISQDTRMQLRDLGRKGETYDQLLQRLIEMAGRVAFFEDIDRIVETEEFVPLDDI
ncbi:MAG: hypothetical protein MUC62_05070 [Candidatus Thermoplasmatota archaeon]|jgi:hypothetical protein|nr:hypothetical protein [Candidatus Thermoplasmatota archaeon]